MTNGGHKIIIDLFLLGNFVTFPAVDFGIHQSYFL